MVVEVNLLALYLFIVLAFVGGFGTCAILCFSRRVDEDEPEQLEVDTHA